MEKIATVTSLIIGLSLLAGQTQANTGQRVAEQMQKSHDATPADCAAGEPAYVCSGVLIRATKPSPNYHTWHHSPNSKAKGGVSFSYLRADIPVTQLAADARSGFTLYPDTQRPPGTVSYQILCAWPTDGDTWTRQNHGCGDNSQTPETEAACHEQGVHTAQAWMERFRESADYKRQCGFDVSRAHPHGRADAFFQSIRTQQLFANELPFPWNEVIVATWDEAASNRLPIQSFFHIEGQHNALAQARMDQQDWHATYGTFIPVIRIRLPQHAGEATTYSYDGGEQAVPAR